jgi:aspartyl aminopeptidase
VYFSSGRRQWKLFIWLIMICCRLQNFVVRNDMGCGSTIGPILASGIGIRTVDCGMPQLSMHSIREMCGTEDVDIAYNHFKAFYQIFTTIDKQLSVDA